MIGGTSGSDTKLCQPSSSQSNSTQTRSSWLGSRKTCAPFDPCSRRLSAPLVEKMLRKRSKSSTCVVARIIWFSSAARHRGRRRYPGESLLSGAAPHRANALCRLNQVLLERPERRRRAAADSGLLVDVLHVVADGLAGDPQAVADRLVGIAAHKRQQDIQLAWGQA